MKSATPGKVLVVGNTDGIGLALTRRLLAAGWQVLGVSRRAAPLEHPHYRHLTADVAEPGYRALLEGALGPLDLCVYCAGVGEPFDAAALSGEAQVFRVNLVGAVETASTVLPPMLAAGAGHFVALSSIGDEVSPEAPGYSASKAGLSAYLGGLSLALRGRGVQVTCVRFGFVDTKMAKSPVKPFMITAEKATDVIMKCLKSRPARVTYPKVMSLLVWMLTRVTWLRLWLA